MLSQHKSNRGCESILKMSANGTSPLPNLVLKLPLNKSVSHDPGADRTKETLTIRKHSETLNSRPRRANVKPISFNDVSPKPRIRNLGADTDGAKDSPNSRPRRANVKPITFIDVSPKPRQRSPRPDAQEKMIETVTGRMGKLTLGGKVFVLAMSDIEILGKLGSGVTGEVFRVKHKPTGTIMAAKKMTWLDQPEERKRILMDLDVMAQHKSPHIVNYFGSLIWNNEVWVFMELMSTCLDRLLKKLKGPVPEDIVCKVAVAVVKALHYLKTEHQVIHRDVKPSNILLDLEGNVKLCDFGISGRLVDSQAFTRGAGCIAYMAPERIDLLRGQEGYDVRADIWSLGVSLVELATGSLPYDCAKFSTDFHLLTHIVESPPPLPEQGSFSPLFYDFISQCLTKNVEKRPHYADLLQHALIKEYEGRTVDVGQWLQTVI